MLGGSNGICSRRIDHQTPELGGRLQIHIINPNTRASDDLEPALGCFKHLARHLGPTPHNQRVALGDLGAQILLRQIVQTLNIAVAPQQMEAGFSEFLGDQNSRLLRLGKPIRISGLGHQFRLVHGLENIENGGGAGIGVVEIGGEGEFLEGNGRIGEGKAERRGLASLF
ncbi:UNVERIFIED_CONTAM: hypothetical protein Slati_3329400 [Sesamum latifolium]|uniref:Uncharacterized protein n=1 Tax=Sesamum latifolium TaxID=2727402 RepID=A0AAW2UFI4_9LAMI